MTERKYDWTEIPGPVIVVDDLPEEYRAAIAREHNRRIEKIAEGLATRLFDDGGDDA